MQPHAPLITVTSSGLHCAAGDFYIDPWRPVARAVITHAHSDHARSGSALYYAATGSKEILLKRLGAETNIQPLEYGEKLSIGRTGVSLHPAGHVLGSAQVRIQTDDTVWVVSGDYKRTPDPTCAPFEVQRCDTFITEATFALPAYAWNPTSLVVADIYDWWQQNRRQGLASVLCCYALGKAQRVLAELLAFTNESVYLHGTVVPLVDIYRAAGIAMVPTQAIEVDVPRGKKKDYAGALIIAPPSASGSPWMKRFGASAVGFCSGWMRVRGARRRGGYDRGFVLSDHVDWPGLIDTAHATGAKRILATHGYSDALVRFLREQGTDAAALSTQYGEEE
jgi:putative mRNA 3-end processing factor